MRRADILIGSRIKWGGHEYDFKEKIVCPDRLDPPYEYS
jgi:hypothetical protein